MGYRIALVLFGIMLVTGCSSVRTVTPSSDAASYRQVNRAVRGKVAVMKLQNGKKLHVVGLNVAADRVTWVDRKANQIESLPTSDVREVSVVKAGPGALGGLLFGAVIGAAAGGVRAIVEGDDPVNEPPAISREEKLRVYPAAHALYASLITTPIGAIIGSRKTFRFESFLTQSGDTVTKR